MLLLAWAKGLDGTLNFGAVFTGVGRLGSFEAKGVALFNGRIPVGARRFDGDNDFDFTLEGSCVETRSLSRFCISKTMDRVFGDGMDRDAEDGMDRDAEDGMDRDAEDGMDRDAEVDGRAGERVGGDRPLGLMFWGVNRFENTFFDGVRIDT